MAYWLIKGDPGDYGFDDLVRDRRTVWDGVTSAPAQKNLRAMKRGDECLFYETGKVKAVVGRCRVSKGPSPDPENERLVVVGLTAGKRLTRPVTLAEVKADSRFADFALVRIGRLSVMPVPAPLWKRLLSMAGE